MLGEFAEIILPLPLGSTFTYRLPDVIREEVKIGSRVIVPFGKRKFYTGIIANIIPEGPKEYAVRDVLYVLDSEPVLRNPQMRLWEWMAEYYLCSIGEVYKAAVPAGLKIESETTFEINPDFDPEDIPTLREREVMVAQLLQTRGKLSLNEIDKATGFKSLPTLMQRLTRMGVAIVSETLVEKYRPKKEKCVKLAFERGNDEALHQAFEQVKGAKKQESMLLTLMHLSNFTLKGQPEVEVPQNALLERSGGTSAILKALVDKGLVMRYTRQISHLASYVCKSLSIPELTEAQNEALRSIHHSFLDKNVTLLRGVTSSGKTEIYAHLIDHVLKQGMQVLYLVPEIALTAQLTSRLRSYFGDKLKVYHSRFSDNERVEIWGNLLHSQDPAVIVGARSSVFLPFAKLGLVIVDEEHEASYKQFDPAPRYNARDTAIMLAHMHGAKTLLGSATPSVETYYKAVSGKYGLVELDERFKGALLPDITIVDLAKEWKKKALSGSLSLPLISAVRQAVDNGGQAIIFQNRRGYSPMARCTQCQFIPRCQHCDVSLTYHKRNDSLVCHYCGSVYPMPQVCPACKEPTIEVVGFGTERVEDEVQEAFPDRKILRMDYDTTRNKSSYENLIDAFSERKADILVGTQMVTKGLDFGAVSVVGVVNADNIINSPDYRSNERAFNMLEQVSGRAGRRDEPGLVLVQTRMPDHPVIGYMRAHDYKGFYQHEISERQAYAYPPFSRLIYIVLKHKDERELDNIASIYGDRLRQLFGTRVQGPAKPAVARIQSLYIRHIMLKVELNASMKKVKEILRSLQAELHASIPAMRNLILYYDVDPS